MTSVSTTSQAWSSSSPPSPSDVEDSGSSSSSKHKHDRLYLSLGSHSTTSNSLNYLHKQPRGYTKAADPLELHRSPVSDEEAFKPPIVRKKSGERVKSSLKLPGLVRARSLPNTKNVHFDSRDYIRRFSRTDQPTAVSVDSSPTIEKRRIEFHCGGDDDSDGSATSSSSDEDDDDDGRRHKPNTEWSIRLSNFVKPEITLDSANVILESIGLAGQDRLVGHVLVKNIHYAKAVTVRYTLDYWKTVSEVTAHYDDDIRKKFRNLNYDKFTFAINLQDLPQHALRTKSMFFCIRYNTNGLEFWDNNGSFNYQIDFSRVSRPTGIRQRPRQNNHARSLSEPPIDDQDFFLDAVSPELAPLDDRIYSSSAQFKTSPTKSKVKKLTSRYNFGASFKQQHHHHHHHHHQHHHHHDETTDDEESFSFPKASSHKPSLTEHLSRPAWDSSSYQDLLNNYCFFKEKKDLKHESQLTTSPTGSASSSSSDDSDSSPTSPSYHDQQKKSFMPSKNDILCQISV